MKTSKRSVSRMAPLQQSQSAMWRTLLKFAILCNEPEVMTHPRLLSRSAEVAHHRKRGDVRRTKAALHALGSEARRLTRVCKLTPAVRGFKRA